MWTSLGRIIIYFVIIINIESKIIEIKCPPPCKCDIFENFKRAICVKQNLITLESYLPIQTELLDLSYNQISDLNDHVFFEQKLLSLKLLNISHNKVSQIHMNAFEGLNKLKTLDLSHNAMQYLLIQWFRSLKLLQELYLRGNSFGKFTDDPQLESKSLRVLDISKCGISYIGLNTFTKLIKLEILDISENYLIQLSDKIVQPLKNLRILKLNNNSFSCNEVMLNLSNYCLKIGIKYEDPCNKKILTKSIEKFQRIIVEETKNIQNSWIFDDDNFENMTITKIIRICSNNQTEVDDLLMEIIKLSPVLFILITLIYGITIGLIIGCSVQIKSKKEKKPQLKNNKRNKRLENILNRNSAEITENLMLSEWNIPESTPIAQRKIL